ncbi:MAG TPA: phenylacetic acid degradation operon negative regulatory protein PaaX [Steroidobacteraceae bacterium]|nr:phenylacetic acid degradation operon negative regulatory protein PaaX [Steroidobacteraceae bacterium]
MTESAATAAARLVARFRKQRPLRAGSLIVTIFGDSIVPRGGAIALGSLIRLAAPFGLSERLVRTATARLAHEGWVEARRVGKRSEYRLSDGGRERFAEATRRIYGEPAASWSGRWTLLVLPALPAAERHRLRKELAWQGFGELASGVFLHPDVPAPGLGSRVGEARLPARSLVFDARLDSPPAPATLVDLGWDLKDLARRYQRFVERFERIEEALAVRPDPETGFILRTLLIHEYRRLHLRDPLLPQRLLPADWPGIRAASLSREIYGKVLSASELHLSAVAAQLGGTLPPADPSIKERFGGLVSGLP